MSDVEDIRKDAARYAAGDSVPPDMVAALISEIPALAQIAQAATDFLAFLDGEPGFASESDNEQSEESAKEHYENELRVAVEEFEQRDQYRIPGPVPRDILAVLEHVKENLQPDRIVRYLLRAVRLRLSLAPTMIVLNDVRMALKDIESELPKGLQGPSAGHSMRGIVIPDICDSEDVAVAIKVNLIEAERIMRELPHREVCGKLICDRRALLAWINGGMVSVSERTWDATNGLAVAALRFLHGDGAREEMESAEIRLQQAAFADQEKIRLAADRVLDILGSKDPKGDGGGA